MTFKKIKIWIAIKLIELSLWLLGSSWTWILVDRGQVLTKQELADWLADEVTKKVFEEDIERKFFDDNGTLDG